MIHRAATPEEIQAALQFGVDIPGRRVYLFGDVAEESVGLAIRGLYLLDSVRPDPIELYVMSYGGSIDDAFALHDVTRTIKSPIYTVAIGKCQSAAPLLVACGQRGERYAGENVAFMVHDARLSVMDEFPSTVGSIVDAERQATTRMAELLGRYSKRRARDWAALFRKKTDTYFGAEQAQEWGLVDHIWSEKA